MKSNKRAFPTIGGRFMAYMVEFKNKYGEWMWIPHKKEKFGIPYPCECQGIVETIGLFGYEQAVALAWAMKAHAKSNGDKIETRLVPYTIHFDIKAYAEKRMIRKIK
jgi:hypothetical protein